MASGKQSGLSLPININLESFLSFLSSLRGIGSTPLIYLSAALLGYTSKSNSDQCTNTFPNCPSDPDKLVQYLNQHNGGFFRFFSGINPPIGLSQNFRTAKESSHTLVPYHKKYLETSAEKRIQTRPAVYIPLIRDEEGLVFDSKDPKRDPKSLRFPPEVTSLQYLESTKTVQFLPDDHDYEYSQNPYRTPKELYYDSYNPNDLDLQRPSPNHRPSTMIFPTRTGTGELKLDPEELNVKNEPIYFDEHRDNTNIKFQSGLEYTPSNDENWNYRDVKSIFTFPS
ncbi:unnamed protein product [Acanthoscelides obtectus]|uniref:Uncharacterized protein n=1 Tax=Acanthoscelides obtectus TaxID=200917 RepID=A0A9P0JUX7_ACAOB|nr:unnamed protein product [Acanthoscelides obtectus]CAK1628067.1 hypothetical protein AOBTE_LOCUS4997 [Acanthoscelides obtectus]